MKLFSPAVNLELNVPWFEDKLQSFKLFSQFSYFLLNEPNEISKKQGLRNYTTNAFFFFFCLLFFFLFLTRSDNRGVETGKFSVTGHICYIVGPQTLNHKKKPQKSSSLVFLSPFTWEAPCSHAYMKIHSVKEF